MQLLSVTVLSGAATGSYPPRGVDPSGILEIACVGFMENGSEYQLTGILGILDRS
jgi:hypothetical protein